MERLARAVVQSLGTVSVPASAALLASVVPSTDSTKVVVTLQVPSSQGAAVTTAVSAAGFPAAVQTALQALGVAPY